jgi:hypothetical protein
LGRAGFFSIKNTEKQPKTKRFAKNKVVVVNGAVEVFVWGRLAERGPTLFF